MKRFQRAGLASQAGALLAGAMLPLSLAPFDVWPVALLSPTLLLLSLTHGSASAAAWRGWLFGLGMWGAGASWVYVSIHDYGAAPLPLAATLTLLFCMGLALFQALTFGAWARWLRPRHGGLLLGFPAAWVLGEWLREWFLTGFPWLYLGYSQLDGPLAGWAPVTGVHGIGLILALSAATGVAWVGAAEARGAHRVRARRLALAIVAAAWALAWPLGRIDWTEPAGEARSVAMVQGNIPQLLKWDPRHLEDTLAVYASMSEPLWGADIVVWPESSVPAYFDLVREFLGTQAAAAAAKGSTLILGLPMRDDEPGARRGYVARNSVIALGPEPGVYHKRHLVPFGEYVPMEGVLRGLIAFFDLPMSSFSGGPAGQPPLRADGVAIAPSICYEVVYPELVRTGAADAALLLTVSNDTWFGASIGPLQHLQMARMRALENGRALIRATNDGVSALVDHRGRVTVRGAQFSREVIRGEVQPRAGRTPYSWVGAWPVLGLCLLMLLPAFVQSGPPRGEDG